MASRARAAATRDVVATVHAQRAASDAHLHLVDGLSLFGPDDAHLLHDGLHPSAEGLDLIAERLLARPHPVTAVHVGSSGSARQFELPR